MQKDILTIYLKAKNKRKKIAQNRTINPYEFMMDSLKNYEVIDTLI